MTKCTHADDACRLGKELPSPTTRHLQRVNAKLRQKTPIICCKQDEIKARINEVLDMCEAAGIANPSTSAAVDGMANAPVKEHLVAHGAILGGAYLIHFISIPKGQEMATIKATSADSSIATAQEAKGFILSFQQMPKGMPQFIFLVARPQGKNEVSKFNLLVCEALAESTRINHMSCAVDGVSCDSEFVQDGITSFLRGKRQCTTVTDPNHNAKNLRHQLTGGSSVATLGDHPIDADMLRNAGVQMDLIRIADFASDLLVTKLCSGDTIENISCSDTPHDGPTRINLFAVNTNDFNAERRVELIWASTIFMTSMTSISPITKRNYVWEAISLIFLACRSDVAAPCRLTEEPAEHQCGCLRAIKQEFSVKDMVEITERSWRMQLLMAGHQFKKHRDQKDGCAATCKEFCKTTEGLCGGPVDVSGAEEIGAAKTVFPILKPCLERTNRKMMPFLELLGVSPSQLSPFCKTKMPSDVESALVAPFQEHMSTAKKAAMQDDETLDNSSADATVADDAAVIVRKRKEELMFELVNDALEEKDKPSSAAGEDVLAPDESRDLPPQPEDNRKETEKSDPSHEIEIMQLLTLILGVSNDSDEKWHQKLPALTQSLLDKWEQKDRHTGSIGGIKKNKGLKQRWFSLSSCTKKAPFTEAKVLSSNEIAIKRDAVVKLKKSKKKKKTEVGCCIVMGICNKFSNKFFVVDQSKDENKPRWKPGLKETEFRLALRMLNWEKSSNLCECSCPDNDDAVGKVHRIAPAHHALEVAGKKEATEMKGKS
jgi:hypothetical protein